MPRISVIIPTYNRCSSLKEAIESVQCQTYQDFEIIVIDDASTDNTYDFCTSITDDRFIYSKVEKNSGGCYARNEGIKKSSGELIAFLDDDDTWYPQKLEKQVEQFDTGQIDLCYCARNVVYANSSKTRISATRPKFNNHLKSIMNDNFIGTTSTIVVKKPFLMTINGFDENLPALQDYDLYIRLFKQGCKAVCIYQPLIYYHVAFEHNNVSCSYDNFTKASGYLLEKYEGDKYFSFFKKAMRIIGIKKALKSRRYFWEMMKRRLKI